VVSYLQRRLFFTRAAVKSTVTVLAVFLVSILSLSILAHPSITYDFATELYKAIPPFHGFVLKTIEIGKAIAQALSPIGWLASAINNALHDVAPSFRNSLEGFGAPITESFAKLDLVQMYILCQNAAAWTSAIVALAYGEYTSRMYRRHKS
jgi:predicted PurR-regulated permease PerM